MRGKDWSRNLDSLATRWSQDFKDGTLLIPGFIPLLLAGSPTFRNISLSFNLAISPCKYHLGCNTQVFPKKASGKRPLPPFLSPQLGTRVRREATMVVYSVMSNTVSISQGLYLIMCTFCFCFPSEAPTSNGTMITNFSFPSPAVCEQMYLTNFLSYLERPPCFLQIKFSSKVFLRPCACYLLEDTAFVFTGVCSQNEHLSGTARKQREIQNQKTIYFIN